MDLRPLIFDMKDIFVALHTRRVAMKKFLLATAFGLASTAAIAGEPYVIDTTHAQIVFAYDHLGFSTTFGMFSGLTGSIDFDAANPAASSVSATFPVTSLNTGLEAREGHFLSGDFFGAEENAIATFVSTGIEVTGETTALITGDLTLNGITKPVVLDTKLTQAGEHPLENKPWIGFFATATVLRTDYDMGQFVPYVSDEVQVQIAFEAKAAE